MKVFAHLYLCLLLCSTFWNVVESTKGIKQRNLGSKSSKKAPSPSPKSGKANDHHHACRSEELHHKSIDLRMEKGSSHSIMEYGPLEVFANCRQGRLSVSVVAKNEQVAGDAPLSVFGHANFPGGFAMEVDPMQAIEMDLWTTWYQGNDIDQGAIERIVEFRLRRGIGDRGFQGYG